MNNVFRRFVRSFLNLSAQVRDKLADLIAEHLDSIHYTNDILRLNIETLNEMLTEQMLTRLFIPLYLGSLIPDAPVGLITFRKNN